MCGRFTQHHSEAEISAQFDVADVLFSPSPRYNIAPTQNVPAIVTGSGSRQLTAFRWGLIPRWAKDAKLAAKMINARCETVADKAAWRTPLQKQRCIIPADGWYEWRQTPDGKQPHYFRRKDGGLFALAGLWDEWRDNSQPDAQPLHTCAVITCPANTLAAPVHDRMPVILHAVDESRWLDSQWNRSLEIIELLRPFPPDEFEVYPVSRAVNSPAGDNPDLIRKI